MHYFKPDLVGYRALFFPGSHTIDRLQLDDPECRRIRADWFSEYVAGHISEDYLKRRNPLVWQEAKRQGLLQSGPPGT